MKKLISILAIFVMVLTAGAQNTDTIRSNMNITSTYELGRNYSLAPEYTSSDWTTNENYGYRKYKHMTPGQLIQASAKMKNDAIIVGCSFAVAGATMSLIGAFGDVQPQARMGLVYAGATTAFVGGVATLAMTVVANKIMKEAGAKMEHIEFTGNGVNVKF